MSAVLPRAAGPTRSLRAELLSCEDPRWTAFVAGHRGATAFHLSGWVAAVADCYRFPAFVLAAVDADGSVAAGMPLVEVRSPSGRSARWVGLPFTDQCAPLASDAATAEHWVAIACDTARSAGITALQIRAAVPAGHRSPAGVRHVLALASDASQVHRGFSRSQVQRNIKRSEREGVRVRPARQRADLTEVFYRLHVSTRRRQGVPVQPRRFFGLIWDNVVAAGNGSVLVAELAGEPLAAAVFLRYNGTVIYKFGASDAAAWSLRPNHALFWRAIQEACAAGDTTFDWGRTDLNNDGLRTFKSTWGAAELPLDYTTVLPSGGSVPAVRDLSASRAARTLAAAIRHSPSWVCMGVGKALYRFTA